MRPQTMLILLSFLMVPALSKTFVLSGALICNTGFQYNMRVIRENNPFVSTVIPKFSFHFRQKNDILFTRKADHYSQSWGGYYHYAVFPNVPESPPNLEHLSLEVIHNCRHYNLTPTHAIVTFPLKLNSHYHAGADGYDYIVRDVNLTDAGVPHEYGYNNWGDKN